MGTIRITQLDGRLPNLALMKIAAHHRSQGDDVRFSRSPYRDMLEPEYAAVYGSAVFDFSAERVARLRAEFPGAIVGGTWDPTNTTTVEALLGLHEDAPLDYSHWPEFTGSIGFTARGCRLKCGFCVVPGKEGKPRAVATVADIWRGPGHPRHLHLLDNDFFGQPVEQWRQRIREIRDGRFKVCFNQGINIRMVNPEVAEALASVSYQDDGFTTRRLYTAWDSLGDERRFLDGVAMLERAGVPPSHLMAYMLVGYDKRETWARVLYRFNRMVALGIRPYPMVFDPIHAHRTIPVGDTNARLADRTLAEFQRWAIRKAYTFVPFEAYDVNAKGRGIMGQGELLEPG